MKRDRQIQLGVVGAIAIAGVIGLALFLGTGSDIGVGFIVVGIPLLIVLGVGAYVRGVVTRSGTTQSEWTQRRARETASGFEDVWSRYQRYLLAYPSWESEQIEESVIEIQSRLNEQGVRFDRESGTATIESNTGRIDEFERIDEKLDVLQDTLKAEFGSFVDAEIDGLEEDFGRLVTAGLVEETAWTAPESSPDAEMEAMANRLDQARGGFEDALDGAVASIEDASSEGTTADGQAAEQLSSHIETVRSDVQRGAYAAAVDAVIEAHQLLESDFEGTMTESAEEIQEFITTVRASRVDAYVPNEHFERLSEIETKLHQIDSALDIAEIRALRLQVHEVGTDIVSDLETGLADDLETLGRGPVPDDYYDRPEAADSSYADALEEMRTPEAFHQMWETAASELTDALDNIRPKASVARAYDEISERIDELLREQDRVGAEDLPVKEPTDFMALFAEEHPEVTFHEEIPAVSLDDEVETAEVTVLAQFETGGERRSATVTVSGNRVTDSTTIETHLAAEVTFDVPHGEYTVIAEPDDSDYRDVEQTVQVDDDCQVKLTIGKVGLRERLCDGMEADVKAHLSEVGPRLNQQFAEEEYLISDSDFPLVDEYVPCLLALWVESEGYDIAQDEDGTVIAFDHHQLRTELDAVFEYNIEPGDHLTFADLRDRFLTAPVPDEVIVETVGAGSEGVEVTETGLRKES